MIQLPMIDKYFGGPEVVFYITFAYGLSSNVTRVFLTWHNARTTLTQANQMRNLLVIGASLTALCLTAYPIAMTILGTERPSAGFWAGIAITAVAGLWNSIMINVGFNLMTLSPQKSAGFFLTAQTATGVITWPLLIVLRLLVIAAGAGEDADLIVAYISFSIVVAFIAGCVPLYLFKTRHDPVLRDVLGPDAASDMKIVKESPSSMTSVFKAIWVPTTCAWLSGVVTFCVFPTQISRWNPQGDFETALYRSFIIYTFSITETLGRSSPAFLLKRFDIKDSFLWSLNIGRALVFVPLFILCSRLGGFPVFSNDWFRLVLVNVFAVSAGVSFALPNVMAPRRVSKADKMHAGTILSLAAVNGKFMGSLLGLVLKLI